MPEMKEKKGKKKGFFAILKESITKSSEGCGPGCGCHAGDKKAKGSAAAGEGKKT